MPTTASCCKGSCGSKRLESARIDRRMVGGLQREPSSVGLEMRSPREFGSALQPANLSGRVGAWTAHSSGQVGRASDKTKGEVLRKKSWLTNSQRKPPISWNGQTDTFTIRLNGLKGRGGRSSVEAEWAPPVTYVVRIREVGSSEWSFGFETPLTGCRFVGLKPDTEYEVEVQSKNAHGESGPALVKHRTGPNGDLGV